VAEQQNVGRRPYFAQGSVANVRDLTPIKWFPLYWHQLLRMRNGPGRGVLSEPHKQVGRTEPKRVLSILKPQSSTAAGCRGHRHIPTERGEKK